MTPEFLLNRFPNYNVDNDDGYVKYKSDIYKWNQTEGINSILNAYKALIYQHAYSANYEQQIVRNMGLDIDLIESSDIHGELLYKLLDEYLETRGTKTSFKILFQLMFNRGVEIIFPRDYLLNLGGYTYLRTNQIVMSGEFQLTNHSGLRGLRSGTVTGIESFQPFYMNGSRYYIINCNNLNDSFIINEPIEVTSYEYNIVYNEIHLPLIDLKITSKGRYYKIGDKIKPNVNQFHNSYFVVSKVSKGGIDIVNIINGGSDYKVGDKVKTANLTHFSAIVSEVDDNGAILKISVRNKGYNFTVLPLLHVNSLGGVGAVVEAESNTIGCVEEVKIQDGSLVYNTGNILYTIESEHGEGLVVKSIAASHYKRSEYKNSVTDTTPKNLLMDSATKHSHSYEIISDVPASKYTEVVEKYNNPSGYVFTAIYTKLNKVNITNIEVSGELIRE